VGGSLVSVTPDDVRWLANRGTSLRQLRDMLGGGR
jgi:hypothetical protein